MDFKEHIAKKIEIEGVGYDEIYAAVSVPPSADMGDWSLPCFKFAKTLHMSPAAIAERIAKDFVGDEFFSSAEAVNGYVNFRLNREKFARDTLNAVLSQKARYGSSKEGDGKTVVIDYSSVNIAKPFHVGHLSSTVIGSALYKIYGFLGYRVVGINHLGDYGTQFGKLICAYRHWGNGEDIERSDIRAINELYVRFNSEATPEMEEEARRYFKLIEDGDPECERLYNAFKDITLRYVNGIYSRLNVRFDSYNGERFFADKTDAVVRELDEKGLLVTSEGAKIVDLENYGLGACMVLRSDGASLYATRDLAAAKYRKDTYDFTKCLYVVAYQQNLHFQQIFKTLELMGYDWARDMVHVAFGMVSLEDGSMSTRNGRVVWLEDVIEKSVQKSKEVIAQKSPDLEERDKVAEIVGVGAVIFGALYNARIKDITFSYDKALSFDGETSVYAQYAYARASSVLSKADEYSMPSSYLPNEREYDIVKALSSFPDVVEDAAERYEPSFVARFSVDLAQKFNKFYIECKILSETGDTRNFRLCLCEATKTVLKTSLNLLGIDVAERM